MKRSSLPSYDLTALGTALGRAAARDLRDDPDVLAEVTVTQGELRRYLLDWLKRDDVAEELRRWLLKQFSREAFFEGAGLEALKAEGDDIAEQELRA